MNENRNEIILGTAGHIDHGKTSLVKALTGVDTDRLPAEKQRGITIDLGFAHMEDETSLISIVDVPGHERFIRNMMAGASGFDVGLLVVAADDGIMPQTREHLEILKLLELQSGIIALTKCDLVPEAWQDMVEEDLRGLVAGTFLDGARIVRVSSSTGAGIGELRTAIFEMARNYQNNRHSRPFELPVDRVFHRPGHGVVVTGTVVSGQAGTGDSVELWPGGEDVRIRSMQSHWAKVEKARAGMRLAMNLAGVKLEELKRGATVAEAGYLKESRWLGVQIRTLEQTTARVRHRGQYRLHLGTAEVALKLILPEGAELEKGATSVALLRTKEPVVAKYGQPFVIRSESPAETVAGGKVIWPEARLVRRREKKAWGLIAELQAAKSDQRLKAWMTLTREVLPDEKTGLREIGLTAEVIQESAQSLRDQGQVVSLGSEGKRHSGEMTRELVDGLIERICKKLKRYHDENPRLTGMPVVQLAGRFADQSPDLLLAVIQSQFARKKLRINGSIISLQDFSPRLTQAERKLRETVLKELIEGQAKPPLLDEFAKSTGVKPATILELLQVIAAEGLAEEIGGGLFVTSDIAMLFRKKVAAWFEEHETMTVAELRDVLDISRKYAVPVAEWLDRTGATRREGDLRFDNRKKTEARSVESSQQI